ncbi:MAG: DUF1211 domain-containing protein [Ruminococcaceae bacterium]|nr:DUF1211 domain-containing protein [Oscillospiraceae bacterium]
MKEKLKSGFIRRHMDDESIAKYDHMLEKRVENAEKLKSGMIGHLSALTDGVVAIFITVMMLEIPYPSSEKTYWGFLWSILVFLVSFFIIADFWYDNKAVFQSVREADHMVVVANFLFLAALALIPATTKWIMNEPNRYSAVNFGIVYFFTTLLQQFLYYAAVRKRFERHLKLFLVIMLTRIGYLLVINAALIVLAFFCPQWAIPLYIILPIVSFFRSGKG